MEMAKLNDAQLEIWEGRSRACSRKLGINHVTFLEKDSSFVVIATNYSNYYYSWLSRISPDISHDPKAKTSSEFKRPTQRPEDPDSNYTQTWWNYTQHHKNMKP